MDTKEIEETLEKYWFHAGEWHLAECVFLLADHGVCNCNHAEIKKEIQSLTPLPKEDEEIVEEFTQHLLDIVEDARNCMLPNEVAEDGYVRTGKDYIKSILTLKNKQIEEAITKGRVSVLEDFDSLMKADAFMGLTNDEWKAVQKFFRYNDEISGWKVTPKD